MDKKIKRPRLTTTQTKFLSAVYEQNQKPNNILRKEISKDFNIPIRTVQIWFQNKRAKDKRLRQNKTDININIQPDTDDKHITITSYDEYYNSFIEENYK
ncbi:hypothetical protein NEAUS04_2551 [Nematocida ausubeli]|uniref:Homeobox domain-containing protein n=1 Tax=Nematocida ausubeli (strain ATCC PRA-371 / ERTm2) TaxID=1913371 RepID=H8ZFQ9_NEMA1|nr:uncharacterized protein NESG_00478 [Nematocida ausubeli]EHY64620.1 hypothetical protein NERG_02430 [Nematocida ausubeli]KAI5138920.1 hypothetical protein NEAUS07_2508 [Nematocida ausubeli]KAI5151548.1 hypothetical protein NEAUS05_2532 [Nematocida ausubeli]KAI5166125.1 hypothetical protein NEAUS04_2551 [Nematocida ausubeli]KFG27400.1 hypothetical protein NESG_00478 [Nematocida ausubeli]